MHDITIRLRFLGGARAGLSSFSGEFSSTDPDPDPLRCNCCSCNAASSLIADILGEFGGRAVIGGVDSGLASLRTAGAWFDNQSEEDRLGYTIK